MMFDLQRRPARSARAQLLPWVFLLLLWAALYLAACFSPPVLDDADATHAQAAEAMLRTGDWVTLHVDGIRYLEKPPLPYWLTAISLRVFGVDSFAVHLPLALTVLGLALLGWGWGDQLQRDEDRVQGVSTGFLTALFVLTSAGVFLFTRIFIPDALLSLLLAATLYASLRALASDRHSVRWALSGWAALAAAVLTKGLVAPAFIFGTLLLYLPLAGEAKRWRRLHPGRGLLLFLAIAAPWHILAGLRNKGGANGHGFFWFYFINEHVLRFLGRRFPPDYNKLPASLYWSLHLVWLFPWSFFAPALGLLLWRHRGRLRRTTRAPMSFASRSVLLLSLFSALVLVFFSLSTNQEYYTFPVYLPLLLLTAFMLQRKELRAKDAALRRCLNGGQIGLAALCVGGAAALAAGLWLSRALPAAKDVGDLLVQRDVAGYTLSMAHLFDLTTAAFSGLRLPASLACGGLLVGGVLSLVLRLRRKDTAATLTLAGTSAVFLVAAHLAFIRFGPMLSSRAFAQRIVQVQASEGYGSAVTVMLYGDQAFGSSIPFYLNRQVLLVDGRSTSMIFGSTFPDAPPIFLTGQQLQAEWGHGTRKILFVPAEHRNDVTRLLPGRTTLLYEHAGKALFTDRPLASPDSNPRLTR